MTDCSELVSLVRQIDAMQRATERAKTHYNPRPPGVIQPGSATEAVLAVLVESGALLSEGQICWKTQRSHSAVSWALIRLQQWGRVKAVADAARNSRYFRYCVVKK